MKVLFYLFLIFTFTGSFLNASPFSLKEKFEKGREGDYIVTEQDHNLSVLLLRSLNHDSLILEEISIPSSFYETLGLSSYREWVEKGAPGHTSWTLFEVSLKTGILQECYSHSQRAWISWEGSEPMLTALLALPLKQLPSSERRKIGPPPLPGEIDQRAFWIPPVVREGKKIVKPKLEAWRTTWPEDTSILSKCRIDLYFDAQNVSFPFPFWLEVYNGHYCFKLSVIDSGQNLHSPLKGTIPHRIPVLLGPPQKKENKLFFYLKSPTYYSSFHLFALDATSHVHHTIPLSATLEKTDQKEIIKLEVSLHELNEHLEVGHSYRWVFIPEHFSDIYSESNELWTWEG